MVGQELYFLGNTVVTLGAGPEISWTPGALHGVLNKTEDGEIHSSNIPNSNKPLNHEHTPVLLLIFPSEQGMQSKQHSGSPFFLAMRVPGGQLSLHTAWGGCTEKNKCNFVIFYIGMN